MVVKRHDSVNHMTWGHVTCPRILHMTRLPDDDYMTHTDGYMTRLDGDHMNCADGNHMNGGLRHVQVEIT